MGIFDKVLGSKTDSMSGAEGVTGILLTAVAADGVLTVEEVHGLSTTVGRMRLFQKMGPRELEKTFEKVMKVAQDKGVEQLLTMSAKAVPTELRATTFALATDLVFSDQDVTESERTYLEKIHEALEVPHDEAMRIVEVMQIKNKG